MNQNNRDLAILAVDRTNNWEWVERGCDFSDYACYHKILWEMNKFIQDNDDGEWIDSVLICLYQEGL